MTSVTVEQILQNFAVASCFIGKSSYTTSYLYFVYDCNSKNDHEVLLCCFGHRGVTSALSDFGG